MAKTPEAGIRELRTNTTSGIHLSMSRRTMHNSSWRNTWDPSDYWAEIQTGPRGWWITPAGG